MTNPRFPDAVTGRRLHVGPLTSYVDTFAQMLLEQGYAISTIKDKLRLVAKFSQWLECHRMGIDALDKQKIAAFLGELHERERRIYHGDITTLKGLITQLVQNGVIPDPAATRKPSALTQVEDEFARYLVQERGLSAATVNNYVPIIRRFLRTRFAQGPLNLAQLRAPDITSFVLDQTRSLSPKRAQLMVTALRSFLRFLLQRGELVVDLAAALPTVADWRLAEVPKYLDPAQVERLLQSCDQHTAVGQRDYTVLLLLARLGLRAGEVVHLRLEDVNWTAGLLTVQAKGGRWKRLPLPVDVGEAMALSLRTGRPPCHTRRVFVRMRAPRVGFASSVAIDSIVHRALQRAGLNPPLKGAHLLRHSLATRMLRSGASLVEIGQLLGHRLPQTTEIYAKVDQSALSALAQPWLGGEA